MNWLEIKEGLVSGRNTEAKSREPLMLFQFSPMQQPLWSAGSAGVSYLGANLMCFLANKNTSTYDSNLYF